MWVVAWGLLRTLGDRIVSLSQKRTRALMKAICHQGGGQKTQNVNICWNSKALSTSIPTVLSNLNIVYDTMCLVYNVYDT